MESPQLHQASPTVASSSGDPLKSSSSSIKVVDDVTSLTSFDPFLEEDEHESSYTLVSSILSRVKNSFAAPLSSAVAAASGTSTANARGSVPPVEQKRPSVGTHPAQVISSVLKSVTDKLRPKIASAAGPTLAPPLVSVIPARPETPVFSSEYEKPTGRSGLLYSQSAESQEGGLFRNDYTRLSNTGRCTQHPYVGQLEAISLSFKSHIRMWGKIITELLDGRRNLQRIE
ncbi:MDM12_1 [Sanghuangporus weigelae]